VVEALSRHPETSSIPILIVTAKQVTAEERQKLNGHVATIVEKGDFDAESFTSEVRRAMSGRLMVA
jgi:hypothetical protein